MSTGTILLLLLIAAVIFFILRRFLLYRKINHYSSAELAEKLKKNRNIIILDVRTDMERKSGKINGSFHIPLHSVKDRMSELNKFRDKEIVCYCRSGSRSLLAAAKLQKAGFNVANLKGGYMQWR